MNKYALAAIKAIELYKDSSIHTPKSAWEEATIDVFPHQTSSQKKGCPKNAFLGLCEEGLVRGIPKGNYTHKANSLNKAYAVEAVGLLRVNPELANDKNQLWDKVIKGVKKSHNSQIDVVLALWENNLIVSDEITGYVATTKKDR